MAAAIGVALGFLALFLREMGLVLAGVVLLGLSFFYVRTGRISDLGWLLVAAGAVPALILGRNAVTSIVDPAVEVGADTWLLLALFASVAVAGGAVAAWSWRRSAA